MMRKLILAIAAFVFCAATASASAQNTLGCDKDKGVQPIDFSQPPNIDFLKGQLLHYRCTKYDEDVAAVLTEARHWVEKRAPQVYKPAIVLDIDETSLSNWTRIVRDDFGYIRKGPCEMGKADQPCGDIAWQKSGEAPALPPTLDLYKAARCIDVPKPETCTKVEVFFVTGRRETLGGSELPSAWTLRNLARAGYADISRDHLYMRDPSSQGPVSKHKIDARISIERRGFTIIANIGDQDSDLVGHHADRPFKVPNPFYFIP